MRRRACQERVRRGCRRRGHVTRHHVHSRDITAAKSQPLDHGRYMMAVTPTPLRHRRYISPAE